MKLKDPEKFNYAEKLYLEGVSLKEIATRLSVAPNTLTKWKNIGGWDAKMDALNISTESLIRKAKKKTAAALDNENFNPDAFSKTVSSLTKLQKRITADDKVATLVTFGNWVVSNIGIEPEITGDFIRLLTAIQDRFILKVLKNNE